MKLNSYIQDQEAALQSENYSDYEKAKEKEKDLRSEYDELSNYLIPKGEDSHIIETESLELSNGEELQYRVDREGYLHYKVNSDFEYYEEKHKTTKFEEVQGHVAKHTLPLLIPGYAGYHYAGKSVKTGVGSAISGEVTGLATDLGGEKFWNPSVRPSNQVKTMIYRTNPVTKETEQLIIDSKDREILDKRGWKKY